MKAHELLSDKSKWAKGAFAYTSAGEPVPENSPHAVSWCLSGALYKCYGIFWEDPLYQKVSQAQPGHWSGRACCYWNDAPSTTFEEVRDLLIRLDV